MSRDNTLWLQGVSALAIMLLHYVMQIDGYPRIANVPAGSLVSVFLIISGFGINESFKQSGLKGYWEKRLKRVLIPYWMVVIFQLPFWDEITAEHVLRNLLCTGSDLWFIDFIMRWYLLYWVGRKLMPRHTGILLLGGALYCTSLPQLMAEQALSFLCGYLISMYYDTIQDWTRRRFAILSAVFLTCAILFLGVKSLPDIQALKGTLPFHLILLNIRLSLALAILPIPLLSPWLKCGLTAFLGRMSYELYIVHYNFMPCIVSRLVNIPVYAACSLGISYVFSHFNRWMKERRQFLYARSALLLCAIAYLFATKYAMRATPHYGFVTLSYLCVTVGVIMVLMKNGMRLLSSKRCFWICLVLFTLALLVVQYHFDPLQNRVDRWSALAYPIQNLLHGEFPYLAKTHLGGYASPFPVWQLFHVPFYLLGNVGLSEIVTSVLFIVSVRYLYGIREAFLAMILLAVSVNLWYEVSVRSDLISNFLLLATFINIIRRRGIRFTDHPLALSAIAGLWLSTRVSTAFPLYILFLPGWLTLSWSRKLLSPLTAVTVFCLTFLPLALWDADTLFHHEFNPFTLQARQGNPGDSIIMLLIASLMAFRCNTDTQYYFRSGLSLALVPVIAYGHRMLLAGQSLNIFDSWCDITYLDAAIPFLIMAICTAPRTLCPGKHVPTNPC